MKCMLCGRENPEDALYCGGCGWPQKKQKRSSSGLIVILGMAAVLLIAAAVIVFCRPTQPESAQTPAASTESAPVESVPTEIAPTEEALPEAVPAQGRIYEKVAELFVVTYWENDLPTLESLTEYKLYGYFEEELDTGRAVDCTAEAEQSTPYDAKRLVDLQVIHGVSIEEAYDVKVNYDTPEKTGSTFVTVGKVEGKWVVVSYVPFYAD